MKIRVGVLFGGMSVEHEVSVISGLQTYHSLKNNKYEPVPIYIAKDGKWYTGDALANIDEYKDIQGLLKKSTNVVLYKDANGAFQLLSLKSSWLGKNKMDEIHVAFPVTHGTYGEDGVLQGLLDYHKIPYVGCDVLSSALGMDKVVMKAVVRNAGLPTVECDAFYAHDWAESQASIVQRLEEHIGYPAIVKPSNLGSSVGIQIAGNQADLIESIKNAFTYSNKVLIEQVVRNLKEVNCSVIGDHEDTEVSVCEEVLKQDEILSYQDKYMNQASKGMSGTSRVIPAQIPEDMTKRIQELARRTFVALGCSGVSRIDFLIDQEQGSVYVNEINTIPGSLAFYLWEPVGKGFEKMTDQLVQLALKRSRLNAQLTFSYDTNILALQGKGGSKKLGK